ncbi:MAG: Gfo/Idh/MocA family oxidoreductase [Chloroflexota bacterium]
MTKRKIGIAGCGTIAFSGQGYLPGLAQLSDKFEIAAACDGVLARAQKVVDDYGATAAFTDIDEMLAKAELDIVINLTPIPVHGEVNLKILRAGCHVVTEKPIAATLAEAQSILAEAKKRKLKVACAPPDMLHPHIQQVRQSVQSGAIGQVCFARVRSSHGGPASFPFWPTDPTWFYKEGSGPLLDMGVYGITQITGILGPAKRVVAFSGITEAEREVAGGPLRGQHIKVEVDDNTLLMLDFGSSAFAVVDGTFNVIAAKGPSLEIYGRRGTVNINNPMMAPGEPLYEVLSLVDQTEPPIWETPNADEVMAGEARVQQLARAIIVEDLAAAIDEGRAPVVSGEHATHVLEIMLKAIESARTGAAIDLTTTFGEPVKKQPVKKQPVKKPANKPAAKPPAKPPVKSAAKPAKQSTIDVSTTQEKGA